MSYILDNSLRESSDCVIISKYGEIPIQTDGNQKYVTDATSVEESFLGFKMCLALTGIFLVNIYACAIDGRIEKSWRVCPFQRTDAKQRWS